MSWSSSKSTKKKDQVALFLDIHFLGYMSLEESQNVKGLKGSQKVI